MTKEAYHGKTSKKAKLRSEVFDKEIVLKKIKKLRIKRKFSFKALNSEHTNFEIDVRSFL